METPKEVQRVAAGHNLDMRQVGDKTPKRLRVRSGEGTVAYWKSKLFRNSYRDRQGKTVEIPEYYARMRHEGVSRRVRLHSSDKDKAAELALSLSERLSREGWHIVTSGQARLPSSPSIEEFCTAYTKAAESMRRSPRPISIANYLRCLRQLCVLAGVKQIRELNRKAIGKAEDSYRSEAHKKGRKGSAVTNTWAKILRNAAACFSGNAREIMERNGLKLENPFDGVERSQDIRRFEPLKPDVIERIMADAPLLLKGDPKAKEPAAIPFSRLYKKDHGKNPQWRAFDFRQPHPDAYIALLLAYGVGLRANEIDKARWDWLKGKPGSYFIEIPDEQTGFKPKSGEGRLVPVQGEIVNAIMQTRNDTSPYIIGGPEMTQKESAGKKTAGKVELGLAYRSPSTFRKISLWLRERGVEKGKARGHPLHTLRKQFGSIVATQHSLFHAQHLLGHSSPVTTSKYYATPTSFPELTHFKVVG